MEHIEGVISYIGKLNYEAEFCIKTLKKVGYRIFHNKKDLDTKNSDLIIISASICENLRELEASNLTRNVPIIVLTKDRYWDGKSIFRYKIHDYILIPLITEEIIHRVKVNILYASIKLGNKQNTTISQYGYKTKNIKNEDVMLTQKTCKYLVDNLNESLSLDEVSKQMGTNRNRLASTFKKIKGMSVFEWLRYQRLCKAKFLICNTENSISNIALEVGYNNFSHFSTAYKRFYGTSPRMQRYTQRKNNITD